MPTSLPSSTIGRHPIRRSNRSRAARSIPVRGVTTVADLLRGLEPPDPAPVAGRGLEAVYYNAARRGGFDASTIVHRGVDTELDFVFAEGSAARERVGAAEFSVQWRGSVHADETGDYEFVVRTPNSVRVWINAGLAPAVPAEAVIDASVSNPADPNHRVTLRLIGGRRYPIAIYFWAVPGKAGAPAPALSLR